MATKGTTYAKKFAGMASGLTTFICCAAIFVKTRGSLDMNTLFHTLYLVIPAAVIVGFFAYQTGKILDGTKKKKKLNKFIK